MIHIDATKKQIEIEGNAGDLMSEFTMIAENLGISLSEKGLFRDKFEFLDKVREALHYSDLGKAGMDPAEAFKAATGKEMTPEQAERARKVHEEDGTHPFTIK